MFHLLHLFLAAQHHAAQQREQARREEEVVMTSYRPDELGEWQFKIVKGTFKTAQQIEAVQKEQTEHGWILVEIFDQNRIRFKRPVKEADNDSFRDGNPYATVSRASGPGCGAALVLLASTAGLWYWVA